MVDTRERDGVWMTREEISVKYVDFDGLLAAIKDAQERLVDLGFDVGTEGDYDGDIAYANITGWRKATPAEITERKRYLKEAADQQRRFEEQQAAQLRERRPDLFK